MHTFPGFTMSALRLLADYDDQPYQLVQLSSLCFSALYLSFHVACSFSTRYCELNLIDKIELLVHLVTPIHCILVGIAGVEGTVLLAAVDVPWTQLPGLSAAVPSCPSLIDVLYLCQ